MDSELVHTVEATAANVHDCEQNCTRKSEPVTKVCAVTAQALQSRNQHQAANIAHNAGLSSCAGVSLQGFAKLISVPAVCCL